MLDMEKVDELRRSYSNEMIDQEIEYLRNSISTFTGTVTDYNALLSIIEHLEAAKGWAAPAPYIPKCECGSAKAGFDSHAHWCPVIGGK